MPQYQDPAAPDALRYLRGRVDDLERDIRILQAGRGKVALDRGDHTAIPNPREGQVMVNYASDKPYFYSRAAWREFGAAGIGPWSIICDGWAETNTGVTYSIGGWYYGSDDVNGDFYTFTQRATTYPNNNGSEDYWTVQVEQRGIYLLDAQFTWESWGTNTGDAIVDLDPDTEAWYPFGFGLGENDAWVDSHVVADATDGQYGSYFRVTGLASLDTGTEFFPKVKQNSGGNGLVVNLNYFKIMRLMDYAALADLTTGDLS